MRALSVALTCAAACTPSYPLGMAHAWPAKHKWLLHGHLACINGMSANANQCIESLHEGATTLHGATSLVFTI
jgi:hypothetical protein